MQCTTRKNSFNNMQCVLLKGFNNAQSTLQKPLSLKGFDFRQHVAHVVRCFTTVCNARCSKYMLLTTCSFIICFIKIKKLYKLVFPFGFALFFYKKFHNSFNVSTYIHSVQYHHWIPCLKIHSHIITHTYQISNNILSQSQIQSQNIGN